MFNTVLIWCGVGRIDAFGVGCLILPFPGWISLSENINTCVCLCVCVRACASASASASAVYVGGVRACASACVCEDVVVGSKNGV